MRMPDWLSRALIYDAIKIIVMAVVGLLMAELRARGLGVAEPILYGLAAAACVGILIAAVQYFISQRLEEPPIDTANVETHIRTWLDNFHLGVTKTEDSDSYFSLGVDTRSGRKLSINRPKNYDRYICILWHWAIPSSEQERLRRLSEPATKLLTRELRMEMARSKIIFVIGTPLTNVVLERLIPITSNLGEHEFIEALNEIEFGAALIRGKVMEIVEQS